MPGLYAFIIIALFVIGAYAGWAGSGWAFWLTGAEDRLALTFLTGAWFAGIGIAAITVIKILTVGIV
jgi:hypothetical protein